MPHQRGRFAWGVRCWRGDEGGIPLPGVTEFMSVLVCVCACVCLGFCVFAYVCVLLCEFVCVSLFICLSLCT